MNKTKIEWVKNPDGSQGYTINPVKGLCPVACPYCYARRMYQRFKWDPTIRYDPRAWLGVGSLRKPSRIFVGSTMELFHDSLSKQYLKWIFEVPLEFPQHTFIFLTKQPQNLLRWSPFPDNCYVGVTATDYWKYVDACNYLSRIEASVKFLSLEPLLSWDKEPSYFFESGGVSWLIIGAQTKPTVLPRIEWVQEIVQAADKAGIRVFLKDNLKPVLNYPFTNPWAYAPNHWDIRQEMPEEVNQCKES